MKIKSLTFKTDCGKELISHPIGIDVDVGGTAKLLFDFDEGKCRLPLFENSVQDPVDKWKETEVELKGSMEVVVTLTEDGVTAKAIGIETNLTLMLVETDLPM